MVCKPLLKHLLHTLTSSQPPRLQPKIYQLLFKTHKLTIFLTAPPSTTIASLKDEALSALVSDINQVENVPNVTTGDEFEICRGIKDKGKLTGEYEVLDTTKQIKDSSLANWEVLFLQFRDASSGEYSMSIIPSHRFLSLFT
jgi:hypothetical protein